MTPLTKDRVAVLMGGLSSENEVSRNSGKGVFEALESRGYDVVAIDWREGDNIAAVIIEPIPANNGLLLQRAAFLAVLRDLTRQRGALLLFDEVISGFGRLGHWWGADYYGVRPDLITFAKGVSSGYLPLGGVILSRKVADVFEADPDFVLRHGHTYSGHPTVCVAGSKAIEITAREELVARASAVGTRLSDGLGSLVSDGLATELRGDGAVWALGLDDRHDAGTVRDQLLDRGVIARGIGSATLAFCPPLVIDDTDIDRCVDAVHDTLR